MVSDAEGEIVVYDEGRPGEDDAEFIVHAPADIDWLITEVERLRSEPTYRDDQGRRLYCPECGGPSPEGYPYEVLHDGRPDPDA